MKKIIVLFFLSSFVLWGQTPNPVLVPVSDETVENLESLWNDLLGMRPGEAYDFIGAPEEVLASRSQGDLLQVVHFYDSFLYLFWFQNRVWQIRADQRFKGSFLGLKMGMNPLEVAAVLGPPRLSENDWLTYELPVIGYPRRLRLKFLNNRLNDLYYFRSDL